MLPPGNIWSRGGEQKMFNFLLYLLFYLFIFGYNEHTLIFFFKYEMLLYKNQNKELK